MGASIYFSGGGYMPRICFLQLNAEDVFISFLIIIFFTIDFINSWAEDRDYIL